MGADKIAKLSHYDDIEIIFTTKHDKSAIVQQLFYEILGAKIIANFADTDQLGTFSGEIERKVSPMHCVKTKCEMGLLANNAFYGLASEGSFGPHPEVFFIPCDEEILCFIDKQRQFVLYETHMSTNTNYAAEVIDNLDGLQTFAQKALFPSHGLILRPNVWNDKSIIFKGVTSEVELITFFEQVKANSSDGKVQVETDMRANYNPSRRAVIKELAKKLAQRLLNCCPQCDTPGWGKVGVERGLPCSACGCETAWVKTEILSCVKCSYQVKQPRADGLSQVEPTYCIECNP